MSTTVRSAGGSLIVLSAIKAANDISAYENPGRNTTVFLGGGIEADLSLTLDELEALLDPQVPAWFPTPDPNQPALELDFSEVEQATEPAPVAPTVKRAPK